MKPRSPIKIMRTVVFALVLREMRTRISAKRGGAFWILFEPIAHIGGMIAFITLIRGREILGVDVTMWLINGVVPFILLRNISLKSMEAVAANKALFSYRQIIPFDTFIARAIVEVIIYASVYILLVVAVAFWGKHTIAMNQPLLFLCYVAVGFILAFSVGIIYCVIGEAFPEIKGVLRMFFWPIYLVSGVIIPVWTMPAEVVSFVSWNPYLHIVEGIRFSVFDNYRTFTQLSVYYPLLVALVMLFFSLILYRARRKILVAI